MIVCDIAEPFTLNDRPTLLFAVQVNFTVVPSTAAIETGLTRKTMKKYEYTTVNKLKNKCMDTCTCIYNHINKQI